MEELLQRAKTRKTLVFCVNGVHRSGNVSCMIMCAVDQTLTPNRAMEHLQKVRCISGPNERLSHRPQHMLGLSEWFDNGGPWTSRAPFLTAGPFFLQRPSNFLCFPPTPTGPFVPSPTDSASRSPAGFPQAPRPRPSLFVRRRIASLPLGGPQYRRQQGNLFSFHPPTPDPSHRRQSVSLSGFGPLPVPAHACPIPRPPSRITSTPPHPRRLSVCPRSKSPSCHIPPTTHPFAPDTTRGPRARLPDHVDR